MSECGIMPLTLISDFDSALWRCVILVNAFNLDKEKLAAEKEKVLERKKEAEAQLKKILKKEKAVTVREETAIGMTFWRFFSKHHADEYEKIIRSDEFKGYVKTPYPRKLFGFDELPGKRDEKTGAGGDGRTYLKVPYGEKEAAKKAGAKWDGSVRKWYVPDGVDTGPFLAWLSDPNPESSPLCDSKRDASNNSGA
jgi:hypothetical protein